MYDKFRLRYGLMWKTKYPPVARPMFLLFVVILLCILASTLDYYWTQTMVLEQVVEIYEPVVKAFHDCERGATGYYYPDGRSFQCQMKL